MTATMPARAAAATPAARSSFHRRVGILVVGAVMLLYLAWAGLVVAATGYSGVKNCIFAAEEPGGAKVPDGASISARVDWPLPATVCVATEPDGTTVEFRP